MEDTQIRHILRAAAFLVACSIASAGPTVYTPCGFFSVGMTEAQLTKAVSPGCWANFDTLLGFAGQVDIHKREAEPNWGPIVATVWMDRIFRHAVTRISTQLVPYTTEKGIVEAFFKLALRIEKSGEGCQVTSSMKANQTKTIRFTVSVRPTHPPAITSGWQPTGQA